MKKNVQKNVAILCVILSNTIDTRMTSHTNAADDYRYENNDGDDDHKRK